MTMAPGYIAAGAARERKKLPSEQSVLVACHAMVWHLEKMAAWVAAGEHKCVLLMKKGVVPARVIDFVAGTSGCGCGQV
jgi:hypothetical protein